MEKFTTLTSHLIPLPYANIDTDMIIPAQYLTTIEKKGLGKYLFQRLKEQNHNFPLNQKIYQGAQIIVANQNFGCGSSREHAVWALLDYGIRVIIAPSFADIFFSNSSKNGLVLVTIPQTLVNQIIKPAQTKKYQLTVNLQSQTLTLQNGQKFRFPFDPFRKECILKGLDDLDYLLSYQKKIAQFKHKR